MSRVFFLHVHKTAGTTLLAALRSSIDEGLVDCSYLARAIEEGEDVYSRATLRRAVVLAGHHVHQNLFASVGVDEPVFVDTVLREPWERASSLCAQQERISSGPLAVDPMTIERYAQLRDPVCRMIVRRFPGWDPGGGSPYRRARAVLQRFSYVGVLDEVGRAFDPIWSQLGLDVPSLPVLNRTPAGAVVADPRPEIRSQFARNHAGDIALYDDAVAGLLGTGRAVVLAEHGLSAVERLRCRAFVLALAARAACQTGRLPRDLRFGWQTMTWMYRNAR